MSAPWSRVRLWSLIPLALLGGGIGFFLSPQAGVLTLGLCACFGLLTAWDDWRQKRIAHQLCQELDRLLHGANTANLDAYTEGAWSVLRSQLLKLMTRLQEQADQLSSDKTQLATFLADISHQLRTPLTAMNLLAAQLAQPELPEDKRRQAGRELRQQLERVDWLISALLRMSRLDAHMVELRQDPVDLAQAIRQAASPLAIAMEVSGQELTISGQASMQGDRAWTVEALSNILKNCMEHTPPGGKISVRLTENPLYAQMEISDTGPGLDPEDLPHLFERFYRGKNAGAQSVGIGLALARRIVAAQNGSVTAQNGSHGGAVFCIRFYRGTI